MREANLTKIKQPKFLTLCKKPANQIAFKVLRHDNKGEQTVDKTANPVLRRRQRRSDEGKLLGIVFDAGTTDESIAATLKAYGLDNYELVTAEDGRLVAMRSDQTIETFNAQTTATVRLSSDHSAVILKPVSNTEGGEKQCIAVRSISFSRDAFPEVADISAWCARNSVDFSEKAVENEDLVRVVRCSAGDDAEEVRKMEVETGVVFTVARADDSSVPPPFVTVVNEEAYGNWGWGQLDFAAYLADVEFSEVARDATEAFSRICYEILFYSPLPVAVKKDLITRASGQFATYVNGLLDSLPAKVLIARRDNMKENQMTTKDKQSAATRSEAEEAQAAAEAAAAAAAAGGEGGEAGDEGANVSRADMEAAIAKNNEVLLAQFGEMLKASRSDGGGEGDDDDEDGDDDDEDDDDSGTAKAITRSIKPLAQSLETLVSSVTTLADRVSELEGTTVVRSDAGDAALKDTNNKRSGSVFVGMFNRKNQAGSEDGH